MVVPENTLIVADTYAFHGRTPSPKPTIRSEVHWHMRRNPFLPWTGLDVKAVPGVQDRALPLNLAVEDFIGRRGGRGSVWRPVGDVMIKDPPRV